MKEKIIIRTDLDCQRLALNMIYLTGHDGKNFAIEGISKAEIDVCNIIFDFETYLQKNDKAADTLLCSLLAKLLITQLIHEGRLSKDEKHSFILNDDDDLVVYYDYSRFIWRVEKKLNTNIQNKYTVVAA